MNQGDYLEVKTKSEKALRSNLYGERPPLGEIFLICAKANYELGYFPFAESLALKCFDYEDPVLIVEAQWLLAMSFRAQGMTE